MENNSFRCSVKTSSSAVQGGYAGDPSHGVYGYQGADEGGACSADPHRPELRRTPWAVLALAGIALVRIARRRRRA